MAKEKTCFIGSQATHATKQGVVNQPCRNLEYFYPNRKLSLADHEKEIVFWALSMDVINLKSVFPSLLLPKTGKLPQSQIWILIKCSSTLNPFPARGFVNSIPRVSL